MLAATFGLSDLSGPCQSLVIPTLRSADDDGTESRRSFRDKPSRPAPDLSELPLLGDVPSFMSRMLADTSLSGESIAMPLDAPSLAEEVIVQLSLPAAAFRGVVSLFVGPYWALVVESLSMRS